MIISTQLLNKLNANLDPTERITTPFNLDNTFHHFKNGNPEPSSSHIWVIGYTWEYKGNSYQWLKCGDWRSGQNYVVKSYDASTETKLSLSNAKKYIEKAEKTAQQQKDSKHSDCKHKWETVFNNLPVKSDLHPYLITKKISNNYRARINNDNLLVPVEHPDHGFVGCQQIFKKDGKFHKFFTKGIRIKGSFSRLTNFNIKTEHTIYITEGYATACSVYEATKKPVVIAFTCHGIIPTIISIRKLNKSIRIVIAADNDHENPKNPGRYHANLAAKQFSNIITRLPKFENPDSLSDFNDLHLTESLETVTKQLEFSNADFVEIRPLGHKSGKYFYVNSQTSEIFSLTAPNHNADNLMAQATRRYWGQKYGFKKDREGGISETPKWDNVKETLFVEQREVGFFEDDKIRGIGGWIDNGKYVFNSGNFLFVNSVKEPISEHSLKTEFIYESKKNTDLNLDNVPSLEEINDLIECFELVSYKNPGDYIYLIGMIILAQVPGFWTWRPHGWITGCRGSGKSTILKWIDDLVFTNNLGIVENATAAGIRGKLDSSSISVILDEAEASSPESKRRMSQVMELARQSSSNTGSTVLRGTATGEAISFSLNSLFIMGSIQPNLNNAADASRFTVIDLTVGNAKDFTLMQKIAEKFPVLKKKLLAFSIKNAELITSNQKIIKQELLSFNKKIDARQSDQLSWLIAAYWTLKHQKEVDVILLDQLFIILNINNSEYIESNQADDENDCLSVILNTESSERNSIYSCIMSDKQNELRSFGIRVLEKLPGNKFNVFFSSKNHKLKQALFSSEYHDYAKIMRRLPQVIMPNKTARLGGVPTKGLVILLELTEDFSDTPSQNNYCSVNDNDINVPF